MRVRIENTKDRDQAVVLEFTAENENDISRHVKAAGDNFRMDYPDVEFDDKMISLDRV